MVTEVEDETGVGKHVGKTNSSNGHNDGREGKEVEENSLEKLYEERYVI